METVKLKADSLVVKAGAKRLSLALASSQEARQVLQLCRDQQRMAGGRKGGL